MAEKASKKTSRARTAKTRTTQVLKTHGTKQLTGFADFIRTQGVVGLAVGLVIGGAVAVVVKSLVNNIVMPPLGLILGSGDGLNGLTLHLGRASSGQDAVLHYGTFLNDFINFVVIAFVIYLVIHGLGFDRWDKKKD